MVEIGITLALLVAAVCVITAGKLKKSAPNLGRSLTVTGEHRIGECEMLVVSELDRFIEDNGKKNAFAVTSEVGLLSTTIKVYKRGRRPVPVHDCGFEIVAEDDERSIASKVRVVQHNLRRDWMRGDQTKEKGG